MASLDHSQMAELYVVRSELEGLAARLAARHATIEEKRVLQDMVNDDYKIVDDPSALSRANRRFHKQIHLASHNRFLVQQNITVEIEGTDTPALYAEWINMFFIA